MKMIRSYRVTDLAEGSVDVFEKEPVLNVRMKGSFMLEFPRGKVSAVLK
jgi:hypothetical protein